VPESLRTSGAGRVAGRGDAVLEQLIELFLAEGFSGFGIAELAARLRCSKSTLYAVAPSKEQIIVAVVRAWFRRATERIEQRLADSSGADRIAAYLEAISDELSPAAPVFFADLDGFAPGREIYRQNTRIAATRVQQLVREAHAGGRPGVDAAFVGVVAGQVMESIQRGELAASIGMDDSTAYRALADLIVAGIAGRTERTTA